MSCDSDESGEQEVENAIVDEVAVAGAVDPVLVAEHQIAHELTVRVGAERDVRKHRLVLNNTNVARAARTADKRKLQGFFSPSVGWETKAKQKVRIMR